LFSWIWLFLGSTPSFGSQNVFSSRDFFIPREVWSEINAFSEDHRVFFAPLKVTFVEKNAGVLIEPEINFELPIGGGDIDLSKLEGRNPGSFRLRFVIPKTTLDFRVFYLSYGIERKIEGIEAGAGCQRAFDLTRGVREWNGLGEKSGLVLNTSFALHLHALSGHWIFVVKLPGKRIEISKVTFIHSRNRQAQCSGLI
jgi:hypothetical protein